MPEGIEVSEKLLGSDVKLEILALFHKNPGLVDRIDAVGRRIGRNASEIEGDVKDLVDIGILHTETTLDSNVIYYDRKNDAEIEKQISYRLTKGLDTPKE